MDDGTSGSSCVCTHSYLGTVSVYLHLCEKLSTMGAKEKQKLLRKPDRIGEVMSAHSEERMKEGAAV